MTLTSLAVFMETWLTLTHTCDTGCTGSTHSAESIPTFIFIVNHSFVSTASSNKPALHHGSISNGRNTRLREISNAAILCEHASMCLLLICVTSEIITPLVINKSDGNDGTLGRCCSINRRPYSFLVSSISATACAAPN